MKVKMEKIKPPHKYKTVYTYAASPSSGHELKPKNYLFQPQDCDCLRSLFNGHSSLCRPVGQNSRSYFRYLIHS
jgi:hypothetical protein